MIPELSFGRFAFASCLGGFWQNVKNSLKRSFLATVLSWRSVRSFPGISIPKPQGISRVVWKPWLVALLKMIHTAPAIVGKWLIFFLGPTIFSGALAVSFRGLVVFIKIHWGLVTLLVDSVVSAVSPTTPRWFASFKKNWESDQKLQYQKPLQS